MTLDEMAEKQTFTNDMIASCIAERNFPLSIPPTKINEVNKALEQNGLTKRATNRKELIAVIYHLGRMHGKLNALYKNELETKLMINWDLLNISGKKIVFRIIAQLLEETAFKADFNRENVIKLVK